MVICMMLMMREVLFDDTDDERARGIYCFWLSCGQHVTLGAERDDGGHVLGGGHRDN